MENIISNPILDRLPAHLRQYVKPQYYDQYTAQDHAVWRYVMRKNISFLKDHAHESYLEGLRKTGITIDHIPSMYGMNRILKDIGWAAASIDGYIPSAPFMEFQAYNVLVIASEIRRQNHIEYTPAPDIIHESSGHSPMLANPEYAEYLRRFGMIGSKAISSKYDRQMYLAVRKVASLKEQAEQNFAAIAQAEQELDAVINQEHEESEMSLVKNLHWWSVEYGLIGSVENHKLYGAGLLSSIGESQWCLTPQVEKKPFTIDTAYQSFDITKPQPQLFVTPDFAHLSMVLEELADNLAVRIGGAQGVSKLIQSEQLGTIELSTGLQVSGTFTRLISYERGNKKEPAYFQLEGPVALSHRDKELIGQSARRHPNGYGSPVGKLKGIHLAIEDMSPRDLQAYGIYEGERVELEFESGVKVKGDVISGTRNIQGKILIIGFKNCLVTYKDETLFTPDMGVYNMAVGKKINSAYAGPADENSFDLIDHEVSGPPKNRVLSPEATAFQKVHLLGNTTPTENELQALWLEIKALTEDNWLLILNFYEYLVDTNSEVTNDVYTKLTALAEDSSIRHLITDGIQFVNEGKSEGLSMV